MKTLFNHILVFTNNKGSLQLFFKGVHWEAKKSSKIFAVSAIFGIISPVIRIRGREGILMLFRNLFKVVQ